MRARNFRCGYSGRSTVQSHEPENQHSSQQYIGELHLTGSIKHLTAARKAHQNWKMGTMVGKNVWRSYSRLPEWKRIFAGRWFTISSSISSGGIAQTTIQRPWTVKKCGTKIFWIGCAPDDYWRLITVRLHRRTTGRVKGRSYFRLLPGLRFWEFNINFALTGERAPDGSLRISAWNKRSLQHLTIRKPLITSFSQHGSVSSNAVHESLNIEFNPFSSGEK